MHLHKNLLWIALSLNLAIFPALGDTSAPDFTSAGNEKILREIIHKIVVAQGSSRYFGKLDNDSIKPELGASSVPQHHNGWRWAWKFERNMHYGPNPDKGSPVSRIAVIDNDGGILFTIFIAYDSGDDFVGRQRTYVISDDPPLSVGYWIKTKQEDSTLKKTIEEAIMSTVWIKRIE